MQHVQVIHSAPPEQLPLQVMEGPVRQTGSVPGRRPGDGQRAASLLAPGGVVANVSNAGPKVANRAGRHRGAATAGSAVTAATNATMVRPAVAAPLCRPAQRSC